MANHAAVEIIKLTDGYSFIITTLYYFNIVQQHNSNRLSGGL